MSFGLPQNIYECLFAVSALISVRACSNFSMIAISVDRFWVNITECTQGSFELQELFRLSCIRFLTPK